MQVQGHLGRGYIHGKHYNYGALKKGSKEAFSEANTTP